MDKEAVKGMFAVLETLCGDIEMQTRSLNGTPEHAAWEVAFDFTLKEDLPGAPYKKGDRAKMLGASLLVWNKEGKIVRQGDYYCWVKPQEH